MIYTDANRAITIELGCVLFMNTIWWNSTQKQTIDSVYYDYEICATGEMRFCFAFLINLTNKRLRQSTNVIEISWFDFCFYLTLESSVDVCVCVYFVCYHYNLQCYQMSFIHFTFFIQLSSCYSCVFLCVCVLWCSVQAISFSQREKMLILEPELLLFIVYQFWISMNIKQRLCLHNNRLIGLFLLLLLLLFIESNVN